MPRWRIGQVKDQAAQWADGVKNKRDPLAAVLAKGFLKRKDDGRYAACLTCHTSLTC
jgi:hypothetical protein